MPLACARGASSSTVSSTRETSANGRASSSSLPASILEKSRISPISDSSVSPEVLAALAYVSCSGVNSVSSSRSAMPRMPLSGVRISWLTVARKRDLARLAVSAWSRALPSALTSISCSSQLSSDNSSMRASSARTLSLCERWRINMKAMMAQVAANNAPTPVA